MDEALLIIFIEWVTIIWLNAVGCIPVIQKGNMCCSTSGIRHATLTANTARNHGRGKEDLRYWYNRNGPFLWHRCHIYFISIHSVMMATIKLMTSAQLLGTIDSICFMLTSTNKCPLVFPFWCRYCTWCNSSFICCSLLYCLK